MTFSHLIGIGLRSVHYSQVLQEKPSIGWLEVHSENFFHKGGLTIDTLCEIRKLYPVSLHGVGLSLGSFDGVDKNHLIRLKSLIDLIDPYLVSEHLSWGRFQKHYLHDLLPIPYTKESLKILSSNIAQVQDYIGREILIENPSSYIQYQDSELEESDFLVKLCKKSGAKILLDVNNVFVSSNNHSWDAKKYIDSIPPYLVKEIHVAGHSEKDISQKSKLLIDTHDNYVCNEVWDLYSYTINKFGNIPTLLEWDVSIPSLDTLIKESSKALRYMSRDNNLYYNHEESRA